LLKPVPVWLGVVFYNKRLSVMGNRGFNQFWGYYAISDDLNNDRLIIKGQYISLQDENLKGKSLRKDERTKKKMP
jgi:hypothetical protein